MEGTEKGTLAEPTEVGASYHQKFQDWLLTKQGLFRLRVGVSFANLSCLGFRASAKHLTTFISAPMVPFRALQKQQQVQILSDIEGLIRPGEMLLVLGRPGSGCSTFLKTLAGETHGLDLGPESRVNYQGA